MLSVVKPSRRRGEGTHWTRRLERASELAGLAGDCGPFSLHPHLNLSVQTRVCPKPGRGARAPFPLTQCLWPRTHFPVHAPAIEDEYSGPKLEDGKVTITFMKELMQWYKDQKKLHRKCAYQVTHLLGATHTCDPRIASRLAVPKQSHTGQVEERGSNGS